jgi:predicted AAA+ superfamily ATPase
MKPKSTGRRTLRLRWDPVLPGLPTENRLDLLHAVKRAAFPSFLLGPRGTGKSTWIKTLYPNTRRHYLLDTSEALRLNRDPSVLFDELKVPPPETWAILDEVQKVPALLNEVHRLIEDLSGLFNPKMFPFYLLMSF